MANRFGPNTDEINSLMTFVIEKHTMARVKTGQPYTSRHHVGLLLGIPIWFLLWVGSAPSVVAQFGLTAAPDFLPLLEAPTKPISTATDSHESAQPAPIAPQPGLVRFPPPHESTQATSDAPSAMPQHLPGTAHEETDPAYAASLYIPPTSIGCHAGSPAPLALEQNGSNLMEEMLQESSTPGRADDPLIRRPGRIFQRQPGLGLSQDFFADAWYFEASGLIMGRNDPNRVWFSYESDNNAHEIMHSQHARTSWQGGWQATIGRCFACDSWRLEGTYWGLAPLRGDASVTHPDFVSSTLEFTDVVYADPSIPGLPEDLFTGAYEQALWRTNEIHNVEINLVRHRIPWEGYRLGVDWLIGIRYFRFDERLTYGSKRHPGPWGTVPELEGYLSDRVENDLVGVQLGFDVVWPIVDCLKLTCRPKVGLYNNHLHNLFEAYRGDGAIFAPNPNPPVGDPILGSYPVLSSDDRFSVLTEIEARLTWQMTRCLSAFVGYRVVAVSEIALADEQFPFYVVDIIDSIQYIDSNGSLILHGGVAGILLSY